MDAALQPRIAAPCQQRVMTEHKVSILRQRVNTSGTKYLCVAAQQIRAHQASSTASLAGTRGSMNFQNAITRLDASAGDRRIAQMRSLTHFLDIFASGDPVLRAGAAEYGKRLRAEGCDSDEIIKIAATALLVAIENEIEQRTFVLDRLPSPWTDCQPGAR